MDSKLIEHLWLCVGRRDTFAVQLDGGTYARVQRALTLADLEAHVAGRQTLGTYLLDQAGRCAFAVLDADQENGLFLLDQARRDLPGVPVYLEQSRRGGHAWIWFDQAAPASDVRAWLAPLAARYGFELYPKQDAGRGVGSLIRLPLGVHKRSGRRYSFLGDDLRPVGRRVSDVLAWLPTVERARVPAAPAPAASGQAARIVRPAPAAPVQFARPGARYKSIREWNAAHDALAVIARYVDLDSHGQGRCPFGEHHAGGVDDHASFQVYAPHAPGGYCWFCHVAGSGGSLFDFLRLYYGLSAQDLWRKLQDGGGVW